MLSFIVPAYNEERVLGATLEAIHRAAAGATDEPYEVVVADDASTDRTAAVAEAGATRVVRVAHRQIAATRNAGAWASHGDWLFFVDADTRIDAEVVGAALAALREGAVGGGAAVRFDEPTPRYARALLPLVVLSFRLTRTAAGCFVFCTRSAFIAAGGFDESHYAAEEIVFSRALRRQGRFVVLRQSVVTSGRKLRSYSAGELLMSMWRVARRGIRGVQQRDGLELWYERREDSGGLPR